MPSKKRKNERKSKENNKENEQVEELNLLWHFRKEFKGWKKDLKKTLGYHPDSEWIVQLICNTKEERNEILKDKKFLTWENCHFQIWKVQKDDWTIYSDLMLSIWIEYLINHTKEWEKSVIQIFSEVWELLLQWNEEWVYTPQQEMEHIENMIKEKFWRKWKCIEVKIWSEQWKNTEVFDALKSREEWKRRFWIIPKDEPDIDKYLETTKKEDLSPLPIIQYLAYHCANDKDGKLMKLFYDTKPPAYIKKDKMIENYKPWCADADYYWLVEVWLRLTEVLKWVYIQWWVWRQRVYDKIISLILNWEDTIQRNNLFDCGDKEEINKYPALEKLHETIRNKSKEKWLNTDFKQLYIELNRNKLDEIDKKVNKWERLKNEIRYGALIFAALSLFLTSDVKHRNWQNRRVKEKLEWQEMEKKRRITNTYPYIDSIKKHDEKYGYIPETQLKHVFEERFKVSDYEHEQKEKLLAEYDLSRFNYINHSLIQDDWEERNEIKDKYSETFRGTYRKYKKCLSAEDFMEYYIELLVWENIGYKKPYEHLKPYKQYIENTFKYWNKIDLSKYNVEEIKINDNETGKEKKFSYYMENEQMRYNLKFVKITRENEKPLIVILADERNNRHEEDFTLEKWKKVLKDLVDKYWKNIGITKITDEE